MLLLIFVPSDNEQRNFDACQRVNEDIIVNTKIWFASGGGVIRGSVATGSTGFSSHLLD